MVLHSMKNGKVFRTLILLFISGRHLEAFSDDEIEDEKLFIIPSYSLKHEGRGDGHCY